MFRRAAKGGSKKKDKRNGVKRGRYNVPDKIDLELLREKIDSLSKTLDENGRAKPLTEKALMGLIRSAVRKKWMSCNSKLAVLESCKEPDYDVNSRSRFRIKCKMCEESFVSTDINIDHINQEASFTKLEDAFEWASSILNAGGLEDLQPLCVPCHYIKTHMDANDFTYEEAVLDKEAIKVQDKKNPKTKGDDKAWLKKRGVVPESNATKRRKQIVDYLRNNP